MSKPNLAFDVNKKLKSQINSVTSVVGTNGVCVPIAATYHQTVKIVNAMVGPVAAMKARIVDVLDNNAVVEALEEVNNSLDILNSGLGQFNLQIDPETINAMNIFNKICLDFNDILPNSMKKFLGKMTDFVNEGLTDVVDFVLPDDISDMLLDSADFLKEGALSDCLSDATDAIMSPITAYRNFIASTGILVLIKRLQKFEKCMTNPNTCNRPKKEFWYPGTKKYNSQYYLELLAVDLKGEVQLSKLNDNFKRFELRMSKTLKKVDAFKTTPIKS